MNGKEKVTSKKKILPNTPLCINVISLPMKSKKG